jgi:hypothetical protein
MSSADATALEKGNDFENALALFLPYALVRSDQAFEQDRRLESNSDQELSISPFDASKSA